MKFFSGEWKLTYHKGRYSGKRLNRVLTMPNGDECNITLLRDVFPVNGKQRVLPIIDIRITNKHHQDINTQIGFNCPVIDPAFESLEMIAELMSDYVVFQLAKRTNIPSKAKNIYEWFCNALFFPTIDTPIEDVWTDFELSTFSPLIVDLVEEKWNESHRKEYINSLPKGFQPVSKEEYEKNFETKNFNHYLQSIYSFFFSNDPSQYDIRKVYFTYENVCHYSGYVSYLYSVQDLLLLIENFFRQAKNPVYDKTWLINTLENGEEVEWLPFYGHTPRNGLMDGKLFLSQWWDISFEVDGILYPTAEHFMMAEKAKLFNDKKSWALIIQASTPQHAKRLGRNVSGFIQTVWDKHCKSIVVEGNYHKFSQNPLLKQYLINTGDKILVEASPYDKIWGIGLHDTHPDIYNPLLWKGENLLGFALMEVRERLKREAKSNNQ